MQQTLSESGFDLKIITFDGDFFDKVNLYEDIKKRDLKASIIVPIFKEACLSQLQFLEENDYPYIRFGNNLFNKELNSQIVKGNGVKSIHDALSYLISYGHKKIGFINTKVPPDGNDHDEKDVYLQTMSKIRKPKSCWYKKIEYVGLDKYWKQYPFKEVVRNYLYENKDITAVISSRHFWCFEILNQALRINKRVPKDLSIVSLGDEDILANAPVPITAMKANRKEMGRVAARMIIDIINQRPAGEKIIRIDSDLVERESVRTLISAGKRKRQYETV